MEFTQEGLQTRNGVYPWFGVSCFVPFLSVPSEVGHPEEFGVYLASVGNKITYLLSAFSSLATFLSGPV
jgi:hypothetical protein